MDTEAVAGLSCPADRWLNFPFLNFNSNLSSFTLKFFYDLNHIISPNFHSVWVEIFGKFDVITEHLPPVIRFPKTKFVPNLSVFNQTLKKYFRLNRLIYEIPIGNIIKAIIWFYMKLLVCQLQTETC